MKKYTCLFLVIVITFMASGVDRDRDASPFSEGVKKGLVIADSGFLTFYSFRDDFSRDTRKDYEISSAFDHPVNEFGVHPMSNRSGVYYCFDKKSLYLEAGIGDSAGIIKKLPEIEEWALHVRFKPIAVYPANGITGITFISSSGDKQAVLEIPGHRSEDIRLHMPSSNGSSVVRSPKGGGYSGIGSLGAVNGESMDRYEIFKPDTVDVTVVWCAGNLSVRIDSDDVIDTSVKKPFPIAQINFTFMNQEGYVDFFEIISLKGFYTSKIMKNPVKNGNLNMLAEVSSSDYFKTFLQCSILTSVAKKELLHPDWTDAFLFEEFPAGLGDLYGTGEYMKYRLELRAAPKGEFTFEGAYSLPQLKWVHFR